MSTIPACRHLALALLLASVAGCGESGNAPATHTGANTNTSTASTTTPSTVKLTINELQPSNKDTITNDKGKASDWIEIYNPGTTAVDLKGFSIADSGTKQTLAESLSVPPEGFVLLWASDSTTQGPAHLGFKLSAKGGDSLTLTDPSGKTVDTVNFGIATDQNSYARFPNGTGAFAWCDKPTPGASNGSACGTP